MGIEDRSGDVARAVANGLSGPVKALPPWLLYDEVGSRLFDRITRLEEYTLTRDERAIFEQDGDSIVEAALALGSGPLSVVELGAGTATKSEILLRALVRRQGPTLYEPVDVSATALATARGRLTRAIPELTVAERVTTHEEALAALSPGAGRRLVLFIGSSIGNLDNDEASTLLGGVRAALGEGGSLLLGTDLVRSPAALLPAYDDASGVTAAFNRNLLVRINRELGAHFETACFRHVVRWNEAASRVELYLESVCDQCVPIDAIGLVVELRAGERIHTESAVKYDLARVDGLLEAAGLTRVRTFFGPEQRFAVHLAR